MKTIIIDGVEYDLTPKALFKKGDWVVYCNEDVDLITGIKETGYLINKGGYIPFTCQGDMRLWTIQDAKDGDVLAVDNIIFIYKITLANHIVSYCRLIGKKFDSFEYARTCNEGNAYVRPSTKEQRDLLFQKMKEAGYEWDSEKKELRKIEDGLENQDKQKPSNNDDAKIKFDYITPNPEFFQWIYDRLKYIYNENPNVDYMLSLKERIEDMQKPAWSEEDKKCEKNLRIYYSRKGCG